VLERLRGAAIVGLVVSLASCAAAGGLRADEPLPSTARQTGAIDGLWYWRLPDTPNGLRPNQSWSGPGTAPNGDVYIAGMDHETNAALYRLRYGRLRYVGDARAASEAAGNWRLGEVAEKFHTRPTWYGGRVYVATQNSAGHNEGYLEKRGFKWYAYRARNERFRELSAAEPGGSGLPHGGLITQAIDGVDGLIYGAVHPTGELVRYDIEAGLTRRLGRPDYGRPYVYPGRFMWVDSRGRLWFTAGNAELEYYGAPYDPAIFNHVRYYDPLTGFGEMPGWSLHDQRAIDNGQCFPENGVCYLSDNAGHVYRFAEDPPSWHYVGSIGDVLTSRYDFVWVFHVAPNQKTAYLLTTRTLLFELDLASGEPTLIADLSMLDPMFEGDKSFYGAGAWSRERFYFAAFDNGPKDSVYLTAIDPERLKQALEDR
jgi:hypothetical protein